LDFKTFHSFNHKGELLGYYTTDKRFFGGEYIASGVEKADDKNGNTYYRYGSNLKGEAVAAIRFSYDSNGDLTFDKKRTAEMNPAVDRKRLEGVIGKEKMPDGEKILIVRRPPAPQ